MESDMRRGLRVKNEKRWEINMNINFFCVWAERKMRPTMLML